MKEKTLLGIIGEFLNELAGFAVLLAVTTFIVGLLFAPAFYKVLANKLGQRMSPSPFVGPNGELVFPSITEEEISNTQIKLKLLKIFLWVICIAMWIFVGIANAVPYTWR